MNDTESTCWLAGGPPTATVCKSPLAWLNRMAQNRLTISALTHSLAFGGSIRSHHWLRPVPSLFNLLLIYTFHPPLIIASSEFSTDISNGRHPTCSCASPLAIQLAAVEYGVVVIGAGLSGLEAARNIHKSGLSVLVLEAKDRIGGKIRSVSNDGNGFVEHGAAWINDTNQSECGPWLKSTAWIQSYNGLRDWIAFRIRTSR
jgi:hypothetical protein